jgi:Na+/melibiose symporter-like transporter
VLGVPTFGLALAITVVTAYLPLIARRFTQSTAVVGLVIATEGLTALWLPLLAGTFSDQLRTRYGGRLPFVLGGTPPLVVSLALLGFADSMAAVVLLVICFFVGYFLVYEPYRALYPDLVADQAAGRSQAVQALWRGAGTGSALVGGGLLFVLAGWAPFVASAFAYLLALALFLSAMAAHRRLPLPEQARDPRGKVGLARALAELRALIAEHPALRAYLAANALWELSPSALKTFVVLFLTSGLGWSVSSAALLIGAAAASILVASPVSGILADRWGRLPLLERTLWIYGSGLLVPMLTQSPAIVLPLLTVIAFGGAVVMTLPYALLLPLMPLRSHGALTGFYSLSRGIGTALGPVIAGAAIPV